MTGTPATSALQGAGIPFAERAYHHDPRAVSYGAEAAEALGVEPERVFKTLMADADGELLVAVIPVPSRLDLRLLAAAAGTKRAAMADPGLAERRTGYVVGGISPIGQRTAHRTFVDETALLWDAVLVSGGRRGLDLELAPSDLVRATDAVVADLAR